MNSRQKRTVPFLQQVKTALRRIGCGLAAICIFSSLVNATDSISWRDTIEIGGSHGLHPDSLPNDRRIKLAISGGGARGLAAVGILQALEERGIAVDAIAGTSIGAVIGGLYAAGYRARALDSIVRAIDFAELFSNQPDRASILFSRRNDRDRHLFALRFDGLQPRLPTALTSAQRVSGLLSSLTNRATYQAASNFDNLPIPFRAVTTDIVSGELVIISQGSLSDAIRAAIAFPLAFTAVEQGEQLLMDGGVLMPIPVDAARQMGDQSLPVIAIDVSSPLMSKEQLQDPIDLINQVSSIMTAEQLARQRQRADLVISPDLGMISATAFDRRDTIIAIGRQAGRTAAEEISVALARVSPDSIRFRVRSVSCDSGPFYLKADIEQRCISVCTRRELIALLQAVVRERRLYQLRAVIVPAPSPALDSQQTDYPVALEITAREAIQRNDLTIMISGNHAFDDLQILNAAQLPDGPLDAAAVRASRERIRQAYDSAGYDLAHVTAVDIDHAAKRLLLTINEGMIRDVAVAQADRSRDWLVRSYVPLTTGKPFSSRNAAKGISNLFATDFFERVHIDPVPADQEAIARITVQEKAFTQLRFGWHWDDEYQSEQFGELLDDNLFGVGLQAAGHVRYAQERQHYEASVKVDRIFFTYLTAQARLSIDRLNRNRYDSLLQLQSDRRERRTGFEFRIGQQLRTLGLLSVGVQFEEVLYQEEDPFVRSRFNLRKLVFQSLVDNLDRLHFPTSGRRSELQLQIAGKILGGREEFTRFQGMGEVYAPLISGLVLHPSIAIGLSRRGLPPTEQFYLGGIHSLFGFRSEQLVGDKFVLLQAELRQKLPLRLYVSARYDLGEVFRRADQIKFSSLRDGFGGVLALDSPIGPFEFGYGITEASRDRFYFRAGLHF